MFSRFLRWHTVKFIDEIKIKIYQNHILNRSVSIKQHDTTLGALPPWSINLGFAVLSCECGGGGVCQTMSFGKRRVGSQFGTVENSWLRTQRRPPGLHWLNFRGRRLPFLMWMTLLVLRCKIWKPRCEFPGQPLLQHQTIFHLIPSKDRNTTITEVRQIHPWEYYNVDHWW